MPGFSDFAEGDEAVWGLRAEQEIHRTAVVG
jgi:hypothetical protein